MKLYAWDEFMALGEKKPAEPVAPKPEDIATIMYTSGTTGAHARAPCHSLSDFTTHSPVEAA